MKMTDEFNMPVKISKNESNPSWYILDNEETLVCSVLDESEAKHVANAINCHDDMYKELEMCKVMMDNFFFNTGSIGARNQATTIETLLAKTRGEHNEN